MSEPTARPGEGGEPTGVEEIRADVEQTRAELADTVDQLADKLNVKLQARHRADELKHTVAEKTALAKHAAPPSVQRAIDKVGEKAGPVAHQVNTKTAPHRSKIAAGLAGAVVLLIVVRRARRRDGDA